MEKSAENMKAAEQLEKDKFFAAAVNRFYYSMFQMMLSKLPEEERERQAKGYASHLDACRVICAEVAGPQQQKFTNAFYEVRKKRTDADYRDRNILERDVDAASAAARIVIGLIGK